MKNKKQSIKEWHILVCMLFLIISSCSERTEEYYLNHFEKNQDEFEKLSRLLFNKYQNDSAFAQQVRVVFINPNAEDADIKSQIVDDEIISFMEQLSIRSIYLEREGTCKIDSQRFDNIYFRVDKEDYYPTVDFIFSFCDTTYFDYQSKTIRRISISKHWQCLIDNNYP